MTIKDMKYTTVEDVLKLREAAVKMEVEKEALAAHVERQASVIFQALAAIEDGDIHAAPLRRGPRATQQ